MFLRISVCLFVFLRGERRLINPCMGGGGVGGGGVMSSSSCPVVSPKREPGESHPRSQWRTGLFRALPSHLVGFSQPYHTLQLLTVHTVYKLNYCSY